MLLFNLYTTPSNDLDNPGRIGLVQRALTALAPGGEPVLIEPVLIEPALRETSRDLHRVRDHVLGPRAGPCARAVHAGGRARSWPASATGAIQAQLELDARPLRRLGDEQHVHLAGELELVSTCRRGLMSQLKPTRSGGSNARIRAQRHSLPSSARS